MGVPSGKGRVAVLRLALVALLGVVVVGAAAWWGQRRLIYFPDPVDVPAAATIVPGAQDVILDTSDGLRLRAWLVAPTRRTRNMAILVAPGNAGNRLGRAPLASALSGAGFTVLLMDYRGYGGNPGPPAGLVLRSPFEDLAAVGKHHYPMLPVRALLRDRYPVADLVGRITAPTVVIYGAADSIVPPRQSRAVAARAGGPVRLVRVDGADHNDPLLVDGQPVIAAIVHLADQLG